MKKLFLAAAIIFVTLSVSSCGNNDNKPDLTKEKLNSTATSSATQTEKQPTVTENTTPITFATEEKKKEPVYFMSQQGNNYENLLKLNTDKTFLLSVNSYEYFVDVSGTYTEDDNKIVFTPTQPDGYSGFTAEKFSENRYVFYVGENIGIGTIYDGTAFTPINEEKYIKDKENIDRFNDIAFD